MTENGMMNTNNTVCGANHDGAMSLAAPGDYGVACYRIPALAEAPNGWILAAFDARPHNCQDAPQANSIVQCISKDGGRSFEPQHVVAAGHDGVDKYGYSDPSYVVDRQTGEVFLFFVKSYDAGFGTSQAGVDPSARTVLQAAVTSSIDNGVTWSEPRIITADYVAISRDGGATYGPVIRETQLPDPENNAQIARAFPDAPEGSAQAKVLLYSSSSPSDRIDGLVRVSIDDGKTWSAGRRFTTGPMAYSVIAALSHKAGGGYGLLYEGDNNNIMYTRISLDWLNGQLNVDGIGGFPLSGEGGC